MGVARMSRDVISYSSSIDKKFSIIVNWKNNLLSH